MYPSCIIDRVHGRPSLKPEMGCYGDGRDVCICPKGLSVIPLCARWVVFPLVTIIRGKDQRPIVHGNGLFPVFFLCHQG